MTCEACATLGASFDQSDGWTCISETAPLGAACVVQPCAADRASCNAGVMGCETDITQAATCGSCATSCATGRACQAESGGFRCECGGAGDCDFGQSCNSGRCSCGNNDSLCDPADVFGTTDPLFTCSGGSPNRTCVRL